MPPSFKGLAHVDGNLLLIVALIAPCAVLLGVRNRFAVSDDCYLVLPLFRLVGARCITALRRVEKPPASPQQSPVAEFLGPRKAANSRSVKRPGKTGGKSYRG
jgi:hypothetical protein